jgi:membrane-bound serine protease (ClpP class)
MITQFFIATSVWSQQNVTVLDIKGPIGPAMQDYFQQGLNEAIKQKSAALILTIDTPGGLESSMRGINHLILTSPIPVISYVAPTGARAASAGTYIIYASHLSAMADGTTLGAATPLEMTMPFSNGDEKNALSIHQQKIMHDAVAYIRSLAALHNHNTD